MTPRRSRKGFSLVEVLVALILLEICLIGVAGLFALASGRFARAVLVERAAAEAGVVADSLSRAGNGGSGESVRGPWRVSWEDSDGGRVVRVSLLSDPERAAVVEVRLP